VTFSEGWDLLPRGRSAVNRRVAAASLLASVDAGGEIPGDARSARLRSVRPARSVGKVSPAPGGAVDPVPQSLCWPGWRPNRGLRLTNSGAVRAKHRASSLRSTDPRAGSGPAHLDPGGALPRRRSRGDVSVERSGESSRLPDSSSGRAAARAQQPAPASKATPARRRRLQRIPAAHRCRRFAIGPPAGWHRFKLLRSALLDRGPAVAEAAVMNRSSCQQRAG